jgi:hypothetical protein
MSWTLSGPLSLARPVALSPHCREPVVDKRALGRSTGTVVSRPSNGARPDDANVMKPSTEGTVPGR